MPWYARIGLLMVFALGLPFILGSDGCSGGGIFAVDEPTEIAIGAKGAKDVEAEYTVVTGTPDAWRVDSIGQKIAAGSQRPKLPWTFKIVEMKDVNAFALSGGPIYVTTGLLALKVSDDELAGVLAHEVAHVNQRHSAKAIEQAMTVGILSEIALGNSDDRTRAAVGLAVQLGLQLPHSRAAEYEADALGVRFAYNGGYATSGLVDFLKRLDKLTGAAKTPEWISDHPATKARVDRTLKIAEEVSALKRPVPIELSAYDRKVIKNLPTK